MNFSTQYFKKTTLVVSLMFFIFSFSACGEDSPSTDNNTTTTNQDPTQYGVPFANVPDAPDATIYQVNIRSFSSTGNFQGVINRLDSIKSLGINVIYLMPIYPVGSLKSVNSPYCVKDYKSVNSEFGTLTDLRVLIDGAHERGMAVILDWVANHTSWDNAWINTPTWYVRNAAGEIQSPSGWTDVAQLNFSNYDMRKAMIKAMKYWVLTANCDGFRCDYADGPPADFWKQAIDTLRNIKTHKLLMLAEGNRSDHFSSGFDYIFGFKFYEQLKTIFSNNQPVTNINTINSSEYTGAGTNNRVVRYITNHDVNSSDGTPQDLFGGYAGSVSAFIVAAYMKSIPMIYDGQEVGTPYQLTFPFTGIYIDWTLNKELTQIYKKIIAIRNDNEAIRKGTLYTYSNQDVCAFKKTLNNSSVLVICNFRNETLSFSLPQELQNSDWTDAFTGSSAHLDTNINLTPYQYLVLK